MVYYRRRRTTVMRRPRYRRRTRTVRRRPVRRYGSRRVSKRTNVKIPGYVQPDYTLVRMKDRNVFVTGPGTTPTEEGQYSQIDFIIHGSDLYNAFALVEDAIPTQPTGFNQWMSFYNKFMVHQSGLSITPIAYAPTENQNTNIPYILTITPVSVSTLAESDISFEEQPYSKSKTFASGLIRFSDALPAAGQDSVGQQMLTSVYNTIQTKKIMGVKDVADEDSYKGSRNASPSDMFYWQVTITSLVPWDGTTAVSRYTLNPFYIQARLYYKVQLLDRLAVPDSNYEESDPEEE